MLKKANTNNLRLTAIHKISLFSGTNMTASSGFLLLTVIKAQSVIARKRSFVAATTDVSPDLTYSYEAGHTVVPTYDFPECVYRYVAEECQCCILPCPPFLPWVLQQPHRYERKLFLQIFDIYKCPEPHTQCRDTQVQMSKTLLI
jgi:hypothetical protein